MADFFVKIFAADNIINPQNPGFLPSEDAANLSDLAIGDQITWMGGGESTLISITDNLDAKFDEALNNQTLTSDVTFDGSSYGAGQVVTPTYTIVFSGSDGNTYTMTSLNFSYNTSLEVADAVFWEGSIPPSGTVLTVNEEINPTAGTSRDYADMVVCFATGTHIATPHGERRVESLKVGDQVETFEGHICPIRWIGARHVGARELALHPPLLPVRITRGALGDGLPARDLVVSPQHRVMTCSKIANRMFGCADVLVSAKFLTVLPGVYIDTNVHSVRYHHILLDRHEILRAEGAPAESLYLGEQALKAMPPESLEEIRKLFPVIARAAFQPSCTRAIPPIKQQKRLVQRHIENNKPLLMRL